MPAPTATRDFTRTFGVAVRAMDDEKRSVDVVASTDAIDSYDEVISQDDWKLDRYKANPVVLWNHNRGSMFAADPSASLPIGSASKVRVEGGKLLATLSFVDAKANPIAEKVWEGFKQGSIRAVSVGFRPDDVRSEKRNGKDVYVLRGCELHEISAVPIGANEEAVAEARAKAIDQMRALAAQHDPHKLESKNMSHLVAMAALLGLAATASESDVTDATRATKAKADKATDLETQLAAERVRVKTLETEGTALRSQNEKLVTERDASELRAKTAEDGILEKTVDDFVGVKITPAEKDTFLELAKSNRPLFDKMIGQRADLKLTGKAALGNTKADVGTAAGDANGDALAAHIFGEGHAA